MKTYVIQFYYDPNPDDPEPIQSGGILVNPGQYIELEEISPTNGEIKSILVGIPPGPSYGLKFQLLLNDEQIFPRTGWFGFENYASVLDVHWPVKQGDRLRLRVVNETTQGPYFLNVTVFIEGE